MQEGRKKFTFRTKNPDDFCRKCIRRSELCILFAEVRKRERRRKEADPLGSGGSETSGDPLGASGELYPQQNMTASQSSPRKR